MASSRHSSFTNTYITETKRTVVVDIGSRFVKCGYASEGYPRNIFVAPKKWHNYGAILERSEEFKTINYKKWSTHYKRSLQEGVEYFLSQVSERYLNKLWI